MRLTNVLNQFILYLPNVFTAVVIGFVGIVIANIAFEAAKKDLEKKPMPRS